MIRWWPPLAGILATEHGEPEPVAVLACDRAYATSPWLVAGNDGFVTWVAFDDVQLVDGAIRRAIESAAVVMRETSEREQEQAA